MDARRQLDCRSLRCPMPIVRVALAIQQMQVGEELLVAATDPAFLIDLRAWSRVSGHEIVAVEDGDPKQATVRKVRP